MQAVDRSARTAATDEDGVDHIGSDTPRSGVATPQPDLQDKRLPGMMSYFGQVCQDPPQIHPQDHNHHLNHHPSPSPSLSATTITTTTTNSPSALDSVALDLKRSLLGQDAPPKARQSRACAESSWRCSATLPVDAHISSRPGSSLPQHRSEAVLQAQSASHPYPTPPSSHPPSSEGSMTRDSAPPAPASALSATRGPGPGSDRSGPACAAADSSADSSAEASAKASSAEHLARPSAEAPEPSAEPLAAAQPQVSAPASDLVGAAALQVVRPDASSQLPRASAALAEPPCPELPAAAAAAAANDDDDEADADARKWNSSEGIRALTRPVTFQSAPPTPTRALSAARSSLSDGKDAPSRSSHDGTDASAPHTPRSASSSGVQAPAPKGKLTIKITEARGLRCCRDPYVVAVFQRGELISGGPRPAEDDEPPSNHHHHNHPPSAFGGVPIQRQASDSGRPMAIPMRSRQSSNTSITDYNTFRNRSARGPVSNPKWDAEAVLYDLPSLPLGPLGLRNASARVPASCNVYEWFFLADLSSDVVDSNMLVDISVYDQSAAGEEFLGHVDFQAAGDHDGPVKGWFPLRGHADTVAENAPTGEIYVEALYQRSEKKHFGPSDFEILKLIGKGTFGQVYQVRKRDTQRIYAMKVLQKKVIVQKKEVAHTVGERNILVRTAMSDSPFIVGLKFSFQTPSELYLVTDYMSGGELFWHLQKEGRFDERRAKFYIAELILAIQHLHNNDIVYRDLKPENILLDANGHIALCDFGLSKANLTKNDTTNTFCGTTEYLAPEVLLDESGYTKMVDFWSLGVLVFEMCCGWSPFYAEDTQQMYKNIAFGKVRFPRDTLSQEGRNFVKGLLNRNPKHRLGATDDAEELKRHTFFADIDWEILAKKLITPPFRPKLKSETDVSYFDPEFTNALDQNGSLNERAAALARGYAASTPLSPSVQANFQGFTFVDESALDEHMKDRIRPEDEEMRETHGDHNDDDWDNLDDIDATKSNRMSGVVKTSIGDDQMIGGAQFDV